MRRSPTALMSVLALSTGLAAALAAGTSGRPSTWANSNENVVP